MKEANSWKRENPASWREGLELEYIFLVKFIHLVHKFPTSN